MKDARILLDVAENIRQQREIWPPTIVDRLPFLVNHVKDLE